MTKFKEGDIVQLKSGGPKMTVTGFSTSGYLYCKWFAGSKLQDGSFNPESLEAVKEEETE
jgi:uncharacterized protein YodC (DUF2158 family)